MIATIGRMTTVINAIFSKHTVRGQGEQERLLYGVRNAKSISAQGTNAHSTM